MFHSSVGSVGYQVLISPLPSPVTSYLLLPFRFQADLARILAEQEESQEPTEERITREKAALLEAGAKLIEMEADLVDTRAAEMSDVVKRKDQLEDDLRKEWEELEVRHFDGTMVRNDQES